MDLNLGNLTWYKFWESKLSLYKSLMHDRKNETDFRPVSWQKQECSRMLWKCVKYGDSVLNAEKVWS